MRWFFEHTLPTALPNEPPFVAICLNEQWLALLLAVVERLEWSTSWVEGTNQDDLNRALGWLYYQLVTNEGCAEVGADQNEAILAWLQALEDKLDGTLPFIPTPQYVPDTTFVTDTSTLTGTQQAARMIALCRVVYAYMGSVAIQAAQQIEDEIAIGIVATIAAGIIGSPIVAAIVGAAFGALTGAQLDAVQDEDAWREVVCCMRDNLASAASVDFAAFQASLDACSGLSINGELIRELIDPLNNDTENYNRFLRSMSDEYVRAQAYPETLYDDCGCSTCGDEFNFRSSPFGVSFLAYGGYQSWGKYVPGDGWQALLYPYAGGDENRYVLRLYVKCDEQVDVNIIYFNMSGGGGSDDLLTVQLFDDAGNQVWTSGGLNFGVCVDCIRSVTLPAGSYVGNTIRFLQAGTTLAERVTIHRVSVNNPLP